MKIKKGIGKTLKLKQLKAETAERAERDENAEKFQKFQKFYTFGTYQALVRFQAYLSHKAWTLLFVIGWLQQKDFKYMLYNSRTFDYKIFYNLYTND